jgi:uncharacterized protein YcnI
MQPSASRPAELQRYTLTVPNERGVPTVAVRLEVPDGIGLFLVDRSKDWRTQIEKRNGQIVAVTFGDSTIPPDYYETFQFIAKNPVQEGTIVWNVEQTYQDGEVVSWTGPPGSDTPAARTEIRESAVPTDMVDVESGAAAAAAVTGAVSASDADGHDTLALVLACVAIGLALLGLGISLLRGRPIA